MLYEMFGKIWEVNEIPDDWKEGYLIKLPKKGDLKECKNWRGVEEKVVVIHRGRCNNKVYYRLSHDEVT